MTVAAAGERKWVKTFAPADYCTGYISRDTVSGTSRKTCSTQVTYCYRSKNCEPRNDFPCKVLLGPWCNLNRVHVFAFSRKIVPQSVMSRSKIGATVIEAVYARTLYMQFSRYRELFVENHNFLPHVYGAPLKLQRGLARVVTSTT